MEVESRRGRLSVGKIAANLISQYATLTSVKRQVLFTD
jgi:hypothetical protein